MKQELINKIGPNCLLPFSFMVLWIDNLLFNNDPNGAIKLEVKNRVRSDGRLDIEGWDILIHNVTFEQNSPVNGNVILNWIYSQGSPTCNQLKIIIQSLKLGSFSQLFVEVPVLDAIELDMKVSIHDPYNNVGGRVISYVGRDPADPDFGQPNPSYDIRVSFFQLYIKNFEYIKNCNPYLVVERYTSAKRLKNRKGSWKRDKVLNQLNGTYPMWGGGYKQISYNNGYRPNEIPIISEVQEFDIRPENYIKIWSKFSRPIVPRRVGQNGRYKKRTNGYKAIGRNEKISIRLKIGMKVGGIEILSKPLKYFSIFAKAIDDNGTVIVRYSKL